MITSSTFHQLNFGGNGSLKARAKQGFEQFDVNKDGKISSEDVNATDNNSLKRDILDIINIADTDPEIAGDFDENAEEERTYDLGSVVVKVKRNSSKAEFDFAGGKSNITLKGNDCTIEIVSVANKNVKIKIAGENLTVNSTATANQLKINADNSIINGSDGNDNIFVQTGRNCTINGGKGNDKIKNIGSKNTINGNDGDDYLYTSKGRNNTINAGNGNDTIENKGNKTTINGDAGNDTITSRGFGNTINGGDGDDTIENKSYEFYSLNKAFSAKRLSALFDEKRRTNKLTTITGGDGNDKIINSGYYVNINNISKDDIIEIIQPRDKKPCGRSLYAAPIDTILNFASDEDAENIELYKKTYDHNIGEWVSTRMTLAEYRKSLPA